MARVEPLKLPHVDIRFRKAKSPEDEIEFLKNHMKNLVQQINQNYAVMGRIINLSDDQSATRLRSWMNI